MFNLLIDKLPTEYRGVAINTSFKCALKVLRIIDSEELDEKEKALLIIEVLFSSKLPQDNNLWEFVNKYISGDAEGNDTGGQKTFDFQQDSNRIYSAFRQVYNIDLQKEDLHWWKFLELFKCLPSGTHLASVIEIRTKEIPQGMKTKDKNNLIKLKTAYGLKQKVHLNLNDIFKKRR